MASTNPARTAELETEVARTRGAIRTAEAGIAEIEAKLASGKAKAGGPKAKQLAGLVENVRLWNWRLDQIAAELAMLEKDVADMTPEEVDTVLFPLWAKRYQTAEWLHHERDRVAQTIWPEAWQHAHRFDRKAHRAWKMNSYELERALERIAEHEADLAEVDRQVAVYEDEYERRGRWVRYILCGNNNGHLHYHGCHTLRFDTRVLLVAQASGLDASEVVGKFGTVACSKCFPGAPV